MIATRRVPCALQPNEDESLKQDIEAKEREEQAAEEEAQEDDEDEEE